MAFLLANLSSLLGLGLLTSEVLLARWRNAGTAEGSQDVDRGSLRLLWRVIAASITVAIVLSVCGIGPALRTTGGWLAVTLGLFGAGALLRWWAILHLGRFFTVQVAVASDHRVVDTGPYRWVRHPSYTGLMLQFAGLALAMHNVLALPVMLLPILAALLHRIRVEEAALRTHLGPPYEEYARTHRRLVPMFY